MAYKNAELLYGEKAVNLRLPQSTALLDMKPLKGLPDPQGAVVAALADPIESPPLAEIAEGRENA